MPTDEDLGALQSGQMQLGLFSVQKQEECKTNYDFTKETITKEEQFEKFLEELKTQKLFSIDTETTNVNPMEADLVGISIAYNPQITINNGRVKIDESKPNKTKAFYIPVYHLFGEQLDYDYVLEKLKPVLADKSIYKTTQNGKYDINVFNKCGIELANVVFDTMLASYIKDSSRNHGLKSQAGEHLCYLMKEIETLIGKGKSAITMERVDIDKASDYACDDAFATLELTRFWAKK